MSELNNAVVKAATAMLIKFNNRLNRSQRENEETLRDWATYLCIEKKYTVSQIGNSLTGLMLKGPTFMPSAYEIEAELIPAREDHSELAPIIANEIIQFVQMNHFDLEKNYYHILSNEAQAVIEANGGTRSIRDSENFETMKAQLERLAKGVLAIQAASAKNEKLQSIGIDVKGKVLPMKKPEFRTVDYSGYLPEGSA